MKETFVVKGLGRIKFPLHQIEAYFIPQLNANIISEFHLRQFFSINYINGEKPENDAMIATNLQSKHKITFTRNASNLFRMKSSSARINLSINEVKIKYTREQIKFMIRVHELHRRTGFVDLNMLATMIKNNTIHGEFDLGKITYRDVKNYADSLHQLMCKACTIGKFQNEAASMLDNIETAHCSNTAHMDIMHIIYGDRKRLNFLISKDRYSAFTIVEQIQSLEADDIEMAMQKIINSYKRHGHKLTKVHMDSAASFKALEAELSKMEIQPLYHTPYRHVRRAEASIKTIKKSFRAILADMKYRCPYILYTWAIQWVVDNYNMTLHDAKEIITPFTRFTGNPVSYHNCFRHSFGEIVIFPTNAINPTTDESRAAVGIIIGREKSYRGALIVTDLTNRKTKIRHQFKKIMPNTVIMNQIKLLGSGDPTNKHSDSIEDMVDIEFQLMEEDEIEEDEAIDLSNLANTEGEATENINEAVEENNSDLFNGEATEENSKTRSREDEAIQEIQPRKKKIDDNKKDKNNPQLDTYQSDTFEAEMSEQYMDMYNNYNNISEDTENTSNSEAANGNYNNYNYDNNNIEQEISSDSDSLNELEDAQLIQSESEDENDIKSISEEEIEDNQQFRRSSRTWQPTNRILESFNLHFTEANKDIKIKDSIRIRGIDITRLAVNAEIEQLQKKNVWTPISPSTVVSKLIPSKMIIKEKFDSQNNYEKTKARLVACGNYQIPDPSINTAAPTISTTTLYLYLSIAAKFKMAISIFDITGAYLNATLDEEVYTRINSDVTDLIPKDSTLRKFIRKDGSIVVKLHKCLYGLRISGKRWYETISKFLIEDCGYQRSIFDPCSFYSKKKTLSLIILYVDDILIASQEQDKVEELYANLLRKFEGVSRKDGHQLSFLRMTLGITSDCITIDQTGYINNNFTGSFQYPHNSTFDIRTFANTESDTLAENYFNSKLMQLMYIGIKSRPDILYNLAALSTLKKCDKSIIKIIEQLQGYLKSTQDLKLSFKRDGNFHIKVYADASFQSHADLRSHMGYFIYIDENSSPIVFKSNKIKKRVSSVTEAELIALSEATKYASIIQSQLQEIDIPAPITAFEDNMAGISIAKNRNISFSAKTKYMDRSFLNITDMIEEGALTIKHLSSADQIADILTKATEYATFLKHRAMIFK